MKWSLSSIETVLQEIRSSTSGSGLTLTCCPSFALGWLIPRLGEFCHAHSDVSIKIKPSFLNFPDKSIASASIQYAKKSAAMGTFFMSEWLLPVASPSFVQTHPELESFRTLHPDWLLHDDAPWIEAEVFDEWRMWYSLTGQELPDLQFGQRVAESQMAIAAALSGHGVALARVALVFDDIASGKLIPVYESLVESPAAYYFASATSSSPVRCIASWLRVEGRRFEASVAEQFSADCATSVPPP